MSTHQSFVPEPKLSLLNGVKVSEPTPEQQEDSVAVTTAKVEPAVEGSRPVLAGSSIQPVEDALNSFYPGLLPATKCGLAVVCSMAFKGRTKPIAVMFESPSGFGKTAVVQMFFPIASSDGSSISGQ